MRLLNIRYIALNKLFNVNKDEVAVIYRSHAARVLA